MCSKILNKVITADDLKQIYCPDFISDADNEIDVTEKQIDKYALSNVTFKFDGHITHIKQDILENTKKIYKNDVGKALHLSKICDGVLLLDKQNKHYIIYLEMKSGFSEVRKKAILQIPSSYLKMNSLLKSFTSFDKLQYKEIGLIVSYPSDKNKKDASDNNGKVMASKSSFRYNNHTEIIREKYYSILRDNGVAEFNGKDFYMEKLRNICPEMLFTKLIVVHCPVVDKCGEATVDLDEVFNKLRETVPSLGK